MPATPASDLNLGVIGNSTVAALIDARARIVWGCFPHFDGDPGFCALLSPQHDGGDWAIELDDFDHAEQHYIANTAVLVTLLHDRHGGVVEITDFAPRFRTFGRLYHPMMLMRRVVPLAGTPRLRMLLRPLGNYGAQMPERTSGSNHVRYVLNGITLRLTSDLAVPFVERGLPFILERPLHLVLGPDETLTANVPAFTRDALEKTIAYWREWVRYLSIPFEWQDAVIRAAITLKLCQSEATGAIVAALTTSIPEAPSTQRNWD
jgi:GH15 family glucan-1,4-alpha-glucosidase